MASEQALAFVQELGIEPDSLGGRWVYLFGKWVRTLSADVEESAKTVLATALDRYANKITRSEKRPMTSERIEAAAKTCAEALVETGKFGRDTYVKAFGLVEFVGEGESVDALRAQKVAGIAEALAMFAREAPTQKRCIIGQRCDHHDYIHGYEAEELRKAIEEMIEHGKSVSPRALRRLLDRVDARDSLAYMEAIEEMVGERDKGSTDGG